MLIEKYQINLIFCYPFFKILKVNYVGQVGFTINLFPPSHRFVIPIRIVFGILLAPPCVDEYFVLLF